ncbi:hypothetical protein PS639_01033 [Pseudomonas fluorescens]|nr:hypothetical protein PS639_01033 [Pseudomonas fluorescens]
MVATNQTADFFRVPLALGAQNDLRAAQQRHQQPFGGRVEVDRIEMQLAIVRAHAEALDHRAAVHGDFAVGHHHAFGFAGGTGGVDQVGLMLRQADKRQLASRVIGQICGVLFQAPAGDSGRQLTERFEHRRITEQQTDATVFDHVVQAIQRVFRVQRHVGAASLEDRQQADDHLQRAFQRQTHPDLRPDATLAQHPGQAIGAAVEFGVTQGLSGKGQCRCILAHQRLLAEQMMDALIQPMLARLDAKAVEQVLLFARFQQRQLTEALLRIRQQRFQHIAPMPGHARNARFVEQVGAVGQAATQAVIEVGDFQVEVELGRASIVGQVLDSHAGEGAALLKLPALHVAHHLEQRVVGSAARWLQGLDQMIEWQVLMGLALDHGVANLLEQLADGHLAVELATQHLGVEERTDQPFAFRTNPVGDRGTDAQIVLAAVAVQQHGQRGGHGHEQGQAVFCVEGANPGGKLIAEVETEQFAPMTLHRRTRTVSGQFQQRMFQAQLCGPVVELALPFAGLQPPALPDAVIQVLHRQRCQRRFAVLDKGFVKRAQLTGEDVHRPAFGDDVVQGQHQVVFLLGGLDQASAQQRSGFQIERPVSFVIGQLLDLPFAAIGIQRGEILPVQAHAGLRMNLLAGHAVDTRECSTQGFVAHDQRLQRRFEAPDIEHPAQPRHAADVVGRAVRFHLPEEPHALLGIGQWHRLAAVDCFNGRLLVGVAIGLDQLNLIDECAQFTVLEQRPQRQLDVAGLSGAGNDLRGQQRMTAEGEEIVAQTDLRKAKDFAPDSGDFLFQRGHRFDVFAHLPLRLRQGTTVEFAARAQGHFVQAHELRRNHVFR